MFDYLIFFSCSMAPVYQSDCCKEYQDLGVTGEIMVVGG
jgi:hypothetical protein